MADHSNERLRRKATRGVRQRYRALQMAPGLQVLANVWVLVLVPALTLA